MSFQYSKEAFIDAVTRNDAVFVAGLLELGADPNMVLDKAGITALHFAAQVDAFEVTKLLLLAGANASVRLDDGEEQTPLDVAILHDSKRVRALLENYVQAGSVYC